MERLASNEELVAVSEEFGFPLWLWLGRFDRSAARVEMGKDPEANVAVMEEALGELAGVGSGIGAPGLLADLATALRRVGRFQDAQGIVEFALRRADEQGQHYRDAELHCLRGEILLDNDPLDQHADAHFAHALELARTQGTKTYEIRIATSQARAWQRQGRAGEARELLQPVYDWFTEGFDTRDLKEAKALLEELA